MYVKLSGLMVIAIATAFFPRILVTLGAPQATNFIHFAIVPLACAITIFRAKTRSRYQRETVRLAFFGLMLLLIAIVSSALYNSAGLINTVLSFLLLGEPLLLMLAITSISMPTKSVESFRYWIYVFGFINLLLALGQQYIPFLGNTRAVASWDLIQGVFYFSGGGHVVSASVSITFGLYFFFSAVKQPLWIRISVLLASLLQIVVSDTKQVFLVILLSLVIVVSFKLQRPLQALMYIALFLVSASVLWWAAFNLFENRELVYWVQNQDKLLEGRDLKFSVFSIIHSYFDSSLNWLFGLGPGHTVGRLGGWMLRDYRDLLRPFDMTVSPVSQAVWDATADSPVGDKSSLYSPFFGWAGIWGDLGVLGLASYCFILWVIWTRFCVDEFSRFVLVMVVVFGAIFTQMEEPGYMLFVMSVIALRWQEFQSQKHERSKQAVLKSFVVAQSAQWNGNSLN